MATEDPQPSVDINRVSMKMVVVIGLVLWLITTMVALGAGYTGMQLALAGLKGENALLSKDIAYLQKDLDRVDKLAKAADIGVRALEQRANTLESKTSALETEIRRK